MTDEKLKGQSVLITRPLHQSSTLVESLCFHGAQIEELPLIRICAPDSWADFDRAFRGVDAYEWIVFASANAVETTMARCEQLHLRTGQILQAKIACIGPATEAALIKVRLRPTLVASNAIAETLVAELPVCSGESPRKKILWPRTNIGRTFLKDELEKKCWQVDMVHSYKTEGPENPQQTARTLKQLLQDKKITIITLSSSETARKLHEMLHLTSDNSTESLMLLNDVLLAVIGPETAKTCMSLFGRVDVQAREFTARGLVTAIVEKYSSVI